VSLGLDWSDGSRDKLGTMTVSVVTSLGVDRADLTSHLFVDWLTHLAGDWCTFLHRSLYGDVDLDIPAGLSGHGNTVSLWDLADHRVTLCDWDLVTHGLRHVFGDNLALLSGHRATVGHSHTLRNCHAVRGHDLLVDGNTDGNLHTVRNSLALRNGDTDWHLDTPGDSNSSAGLDRDFPALSLNLLLAVSSGSNGHGSNSNTRGSNGNTRGGNSNARGGNSNARSSNSNTRSSNSSQTGEKELRISLGISIGISLALDEPGLNKSRIKTKSSNQRTDSS